jgi:hypothetical protein
MPAEALVSIIFAALGIAAMGGICLYYRWSR